MRIFKTAIAVEGKGAISCMDTIEYQGEFWLVPSWMEALWNGWKMPSKIVCLSGLRHTHTPGSRLGDFKLLLAAASPELTGASEALQANGYVVRERPDIRLPILELR